MKYLKLGAVSNPKTGSSGFACPASGGFFWALSFDSFPSTFQGVESAQQNPKFYSSFGRSGVTRNT